MKKIEIKKIQARKYWDITAMSNCDLLVIAGVLSAAGTEWDTVDTVLSGGEVVCNTIRVFSGKRRAAKIQKLLSGMQDVGCFKGSLGYEVYPHR